MENLCERLMATDLENEEIWVDLGTVDEVVNKGKNCLLVKLLTNKYFNREAFKYTMHRVRKPVKAIQFHEIGVGIMMAEFNDQSDKYRVIKDGPWNFYKSLTLVKEFEGQQQGKTINMNEASLQIRFFDLPLMARNEYVGNLLGEALGRVEEVDIDYGDVEWGEYMQICICLDITKPLLRKKKMNLGLAEPVQVNFTYERLQTYASAADGQATVTKNVLFGTL